jgi:hypothetical protein
MTIPKQHKIKFGDYSSTTGVGPVRTSSSDGMEEEEEEGKTVDGNSDDGGSGSEDSEDDIEYLRKFYVMPDFHTILKGFVKEEGEAFSDKEQVPSCWNHLTQFLSHNVTYCQLTSYHIISYHFITEME